MINEAISLQTILETRTNAFYNLKRQILKYLTDYLFQLTFIITGILTGDLFFCALHIIVWRIAIRRVCSPRIRGNMVRKVILEPLLRFSDRVCWCSVFSKHVWSSCTNSFNPIKSKPFCYIFWFTFKHNNALHCW